MAEIDVFERGLSGAFLRLADDVTGAVDAAAVAHRVALEHPRPVVLRWRLTAVPRPVWVLLLLAGLLLAMVGGMLVAGSQLHRKLPAVVPPVGQLFECPPGSNPDGPGPVDQVRPPLSYWGSAFDRRAGRIVVVAPTTVDEAPGVATWTFDVCANTWTRMQPNREPPSFDWARLVYDVDSDMTLLVSSGGVWAYDLQADTWTEKGVATWASSAYDPVSGLVVAGLAGPTALVNYDVDSDTWTPIHRTNAGPENAVIAFDASVDRLVAYTRLGGYPVHDTWLFDIRTGTWSQSAAVTPHVLDWLAPPAIAYDEAAKRTVVGGNVRLAAYDATADRWETIELPDAEYPDPNAWHGVSIVYDPVNERLVLFPDTWGQWTDGSDTGVVAFDLVTREWTVLLEPGIGQQPATPATTPAPTSAPTPAR